MQPSHSNAFYMQLFFLNMFQREKKKRGHRFDSLKIALFPAHNIKTTTVYLSNSIRIAKVLINTATSYLDITVTENEKHMGWPLPIPFLVLHQKPIPCC